MKKLLSNVQASWTYRNIQLVVILGLLVGIVVECYGGAALLPKSEAVAYERTDEPDIVEDCDQKCMLNKWAHVRAQELYKENEGMDLEKYRLQALSEGKDLLLSILDESEFMSYTQLEEKFGY